MRPYFAGTIAASLILGSSSTASADPQCDGPNRWAAGSTFTQLKNAGLLSSENVDHARVTSPQIASSKIGRDLYRQVFKITFPLKPGGKVEAIAISDASQEECSMSDVVVYRVVPLDK